MAETPKRPYSERPPLCCTKQREGCAPSCSQLADTPGTGSRTHRSAYQGLNLKKRSSFTFSVGGVFASFTICLAQVSMLSRAWYHQVTDRRSRGRFGGSSRSA